jgi:hypothetical protein
VEVAGEAQLHYTKLSLTEWSFIDCRFIMTSKFTNGEAKMIIGGHGGRPRALPATPLQDSQTRDLVSVGSEQRGTGQICELIISSGSAHPR